MPVAWLRSHGRVGRTDRAVSSRSPGGGLDGAAGGAPHDAAHDPPERAVSPQQEVPRGVRPTAPIAGECLRYGQLSPTVGLKAPAPIRSASTRCQTYIEGDHLDVIRRNAHEVQHHLWDIEPSRARRGESPVPDAAWAARARSASRSGTGSLREPIASRRTASAGECPPVGSKHRAMRGHSRPYRGLGGVRPSAGRPLNLERTS